MTRSLGQELRQLIDKFEAGSAHYLGPRSGYQEMDARSEFIDPLLRLLGWDVENQQALSPEHREVAREQNQRDDHGNDQRPDYTVKANGQSVFYVEAKKPSLDLSRSIDAARQTRAYGWTKKHPIAVLTNFRQIRIYDTSVPVTSTDRITTALLFESDSGNLLHRWDELVGLIGREAVHGDEWINQFATGNSKTNLPADSRFVAQFNDWRLRLGQDLVTRNPELDEHTVNDAVQRVLNRLIFVRMCEDRGIEGEGVLRSAFAGTDAGVADLFSRLNKRYNTGLFADAGTPHDPLMMAGTPALQGIVDELYSPRSPFSFAVLDADFLGLVYEATLAEHLSVSVAGGRREVRLAKKLEYEKRDVVTTPQDLVRDTVNSALEHVTKATPTVLDFATGSGRFLLEAFERLLARETQARLQARDFANLRKIDSNTYTLPYAAKRALLEQSCFGIDIDFNAVEVARFSLIVRLLQDEVAGSLPAAASSILPDLRTNILHGNTLVRAMPPAAAADDDAIAVTRPLNLDQPSFPRSFDMILGNPPYMQTKEMKAYDQWELLYLRTTYATATKQFDKSSAFIEFAASHLADDGVLGLVVPNKWITAESGAPVRHVLRDAVQVRRLVNYGHVQLFEGRSIYVCILVAAKSRAIGFSYSEPGRLRPRGHLVALPAPDPAPFLPDDPAGAWVLPATDEQANLIRTMLRGSVRLGDVSSLRNGVQTSGNSVYILKPFTVENGLVKFRKKDPVSGAMRDWAIEEDSTRPYLDDSKEVRSHHEVVPDARIIFPYQRVQHDRNSSGFEPIPVEVMPARYPLALEYLTAHASQLSKRDMNVGHRGAPFYAYGRTQAIGYATDCPKIFYSTNQKGDKYGLDTQGIVYQSGGTAGEVAIYPRDSGYELDFLLGWLDQKITEFYVRKRGSPFRGGFTARGTAVLNELPVPALNFHSQTDVDFHDRIARGTAELRRLHKLRDEAQEREHGLYDHKITVERLMIEDEFLDRLGLTRQDVAFLND